MNYSLMVFRATLTKTTTFTKLIFFMRNEKLTEAASILSEGLRADPPAHYAGIFKLLLGQIQMANRDFESAVASFDGALESYGTTNSSVEHVIRVEVMKSIALAQSGQIDFSNFSNWKDTIKTIGKPVDRELALIEIHLAWDARRQGDDSAASIYINRLNNIYIPAISAYDSVSAKTLRKMTRDIADRG